VLIETRLARGIPLASGNFAKDGGEEDASWTKIGVAWLHRDGKGFDVVPEALPLNGRAVLRLNVTKAVKE